MELSKRLQTVAGAVTPGNRMADIGTDHGYVPIYLLKNKICPSALAMDVNPGPLERAREHIHREGLEGPIKTRLSNGLEKLSPGETDSIVIAGMGGDLMCRILKAAPEILQKGVELILQPQSEWFKVRHFLADHGYGIEKEWFLEEEGKYYVIIRAVKNMDSRKEERRINQTGQDKEKITVSSSVDLIKELYFEYGYYLIHSKNPVLFEYLQKEAKKKEKIAREMETQVFLESSSLDKMSREFPSQNLQMKQKKRLERCEILKKEVKGIRKLLAEMEEK